MSIKLSDSYRTPKKGFWDDLNEVTPFFWDACCNKDNCLVKEQQTAIEDWSTYTYLNQNMNLALSSIRFICGNSRHPLECPYHDRENASIFINPPYSKKTKDHPGVEGFIRKAWQDAKHFRVVMLLKADMSTNWFNDILEVEGLQPKQFIQGRNTLKVAYSELIRQLSQSYCACCRHRECKQGDIKKQVGVLHLRKRVKFLADGNMIGADGLIYPKSGPTFPSMLVILDRRGE